MNRLELCFGVLEELFRPFVDANRNKELGDVMGYLPLRGIRVNGSYTARKDRLWRLFYAVYTATSLYVESLLLKHLLEHVLSIEKVRVWNMCNAFKFLPLVATILRELILDLQIA